MEAGKYKHINPKKTTDLTLKSDNNCTKLHLTD